MVQASQCTPKREAKPRLPPAVASIPAPAPRAARPAPRPACSAPLPFPPSPSPPPTHRAHHAGAAHEVGSIPLPCVGRIGLVCRFRSSADFSPHHVSDRTSKRTDLASRDQQALKRNRFRAPIRGKPPFAFSTCIVTLKLVGNPSAASAAHSKTWRMFLPP